MTHTCACGNTLTHDTTLPRGDRLPRVIPDRGCGIVNVLRCEGCGLWWLYDGERLHGVTRDAIVEMDAEWRERYYGD